MKIFDRWVEYLLFYDKGAIGVRFNKIVSAFPDGQIKVLGVIPTALIWRLALRSRLISRVFRLGVYSSARFVDRLFFCFHGVIYSIGLKGYDLKEELIIPKGHGPLSFSVISDISGFEDGLYFGEYFSDGGFDPIKIWRRTRSGQWLICYEFEEGLINHCHALVPDKSSGCVWMLTGDVGSAAAIYRVTDDFTNVEVICQGNQEFRACVAFPLNGGLLYATDTQFETNSVRQLYQQDGLWKTKLVHEVNGPVVYGCETQDFYVMSNTVEPGEVRSSSILTLLDRSIGPGILRNRVEVVTLHKESMQMEVIAFDEKDYLPSRLFKFGAASLRTMSFKKNLVAARFTATKQYDGVTIVLDCAKKLVYAIE